MNACASYSVVVALVLVGIVALLCSSSSSQESYVDLSQSEFLPKTVSFLERRQCYFPPPDYGQYTYAGCRCSRVGTPMHNGVVKWQNSGLYTFPR